MNFFRAFISGIALAMCAPTYLPPGPPVREPERIINQAFQEAQNWNDEREHHKPQLVFLGFYSPNSRMPGPEVEFVDRAWPREADRGPGYYGIAITVTEDGEKIPTIGYHHVVPDDAWPRSWTSLDRQRRDVIRLLQRAQAEIAREELQGGDVSRLALDEVKVHYHQNPPVILIVFEEPALRQKNDDGEVTKRLYKRQWALHEALAKY